MGPGNSDHLETCVSAGGQSRGIFRISIYGKAKSGRQEFSPPALWPASVSKTFGRARPDPDGPTGFPSNPNGQPQVKQWDPTLDGLRHRFRKRPRRTVASL